MICVSIHVSHQNIFGIAAPITLYLALDIFEIVLKCVFCSQLREMPLISPERPWQVDPAQVAARRDLRDSHLVFSIDPQGCEDVDDTLSVRSLANGGVLELGVHIADVTHFVKEGSFTDLEARLR